jgi:hypothetical protein
MFAAAIMREVEIVRKMEMGRDVDGDIEIQKCKVELKMTQDLLQHIQSLRVFTKKEIQVPSPPPPSLRLQEKNVAFKSIQ